MNSHSEQTVNSDKYKFEFEFEMKWVSSEWEWELGWGTAKETSMLNLFLFQV